MSATLVFTSLLPVRLSPNATFSLIVMCGNSA